METQTLTYVLLLLIGIFIGVAITGVLWLLSNEKQIRDSVDQLPKLTDEEMQDLRMYGTTKREERYGKVR